MLAASEAELEDEEDEEDSPSEPADPDPERGGDCQWLPALSPLARLASRSPKAIAAACSQSSFSASIDSSWESWA